MPSKTYVAAVGHWPSLELALQLWWVGCLLVAVELARCTAVRIRNSCSLSLLDRRGKLHSQYHSQTCTKPTVVICRPRTDCSDLSNISSPEPPRGPLLLL